MATLKMPIIALLKLLYTVLKAKKSCLEKKEAFTLQQKPLNRLKMREKNTEINTEKKNGRLHNGFVGIFV